MAEIPEPVWVVIGVAAFASCWAMMYLCVSRVSGWHELAERFADDGSYRGPMLHFCSARLNWTVTYNATLFLGANSRGLFMSVIWPFRFGHRPLFIPWSEIEMEETRSFFIKVVRFRMRNCPGVEVDIPWRTAGRLLKFREHVH